MSTRLDDLLNEAERLARLTREQVRLVAQETADLAAIDRMRQSLAGGDVIPFPLNRSCRTWLKRRPLNGVVLPFVRNTQGVTSIEYSVLCAGIGLAIIAIVSSLGGTLGASFQSIAAYLGGS
ncbi:Flp pilus assembly pilin Flp [Bradyrhizobium sp. USDA 4341]